MYDYVQLKACHSKEILYKPFLGSSTGQAYRLRAHFVFQTCHGSALIRILNRQA